MAFVALVVSEGGVASLSLLGVGRWRFFGGRSHFCLFLNARIDLGRDFIAAAERGGPLLLLWFVGFGSEGGMRQVPLLVRCVVAAGAWSICGGVVRPTCLLV